MPVFKLNEIGNAYYRGNYINRIYNGNSLAWSNDGLPPTYIPDKPPEPEVPIPIDEPNYRIMNLKTDFGASGNGNTDDFNAMKQALVHSTTEPIKLIIPSGNYRLQGGTNERLESWPAQSKGLIIEGQNATLLPEHNRTYSNHEHYTFQIEGDGSANSYFAIRGVKIDGIRNPKPWHVNRNGEGLPAGDIKITRGIQVNKFRKVVIESNEFKDLYGGYCVMVSNYDLAHLTDNYYNNIGGNNYTESFGMAIYLGGADGNAHAILTRERMYGANNPSDPEQMAWIGVVHENGTVQNDDLSTWDRDANTRIDMIDCEMVNFETAFHSESQAGNVYVNIDGGFSECIDFGIYAGIWGEIKARVNRHKIALLGYHGRGGFIQGLHYTEREVAKNRSGLNDVRFYNCEVDYPTNSNIEYVDYGTTPFGKRYNYYEVAVTLGDEAVARLYNCTLNNVPYQLVRNASAIFHNSHINKAQNNSMDATSIKGAMNFASNRVEYHNTPINNFGAWKTASLMADPPLVDNTGYVPEPMMKPIAAAKLEQNA